MISIISLKLNSLFAFENILSACMYLMIIIFDTISTSRRDEFDQFRSLIIYPDS